MSGVLTEEVDNANGMGELSCNLPVVAANKFSLLMTGSCTSGDSIVHEETWDKPSFVFLNVYNLGMLPTVLNAIMIPLAGVGAFHAGVEVYGDEWSYCRCDLPDVGIVGTRPRQHPLHEYRESVPLGQTELTRHGVQALLAWLQHQWRGGEYDRLSRNCIHFADAFCKELKVAPLPSWVSSVMAHGTRLRGALERVTVPRCEKLPECDHQPLDHRERQPKAPARAKTSSPIPPHPWQDEAASPMCSARRFGCEEVVSRTPRLPPASVQYEALSEHMAAEVLNEHAAVIGNSRWATLLRSEVKKSRSVKHWAQFSQELRLPVSSV